MDDTTNISITSRFDGSVAMHICYQVVKVLVILLSASLLYPLVVYLYEKWLCEHSFIEGRKLKFLGRLYSVYLIYIVGVVVIAISLYIFNYIVSTLPYFVKASQKRWLVSGIISAINTVVITSRVRKWKKAHTVFEGNASCDNSSLQHNLIKCAVVGAISSVVSTLSLGILIPFVKKAKAQYFINHTLICGNKLFFIGKASTLYKKLPLWILFIIMTLGLYILYINHYLAVWEIENTQLEKN